VVSQTISAVFSFVRGIIFLITYEGQRWCFKVCALDFLINDLLEHCNTFLAYLNLEHKLTQMKRHTHTHTNRHTGCSLFIVFIVFRKQLSFISYRTSLHLALRDITEQEVRQLLSSLSLTKASGLDGLPPKLIKLASPYIYA
jgi:hypothetical protein